MNRRENILNLLIFVLISINAQAGSVYINAKTDTNQIKIGEQFHLDLTATFLKGVRVTFPMLTDTFNSFEVVSKNKLDTISSANNKELTLFQQYTLTGFDSGYFVIPPMPFVVDDGKGKSDTLLSEAMLINIITVQVDTTQEIKAIKNIIDVPFPWLEYLIYVLIALIIVAVIIYVYKRYFKKKKVKIVTPKIPDRPAHEIALEALRRIENEKLWQQGFTKKYYSEVTDAIRQYIEKRFSINAMEQTTDEILSYFEREVVREEEKEKLKFILKLADMVKFAKVHPLPSENETTLQYAFSFVNNTRMVVVEAIEKVEEMV